MKTTLNYYKPNENGSPPRPTYSDPPETYIQPIEAYEVIIRDVAGTRSLHESDLIPMPFIFPGLEAETFSALFSPEHQWYFK